MNSARAVFIVRVRPILRNVKFSSVMLATGLLGALAWKAADLIQTIPPFYIAAMFVFATLGLLLQGMPTPAEYRFLRATIPNKADRVPYIGLSLAWSSFAPLIISLATPFMSLMKALVPPWWLPLMSIGVWAFLNAIGGFVADRFLIKSPERQGHAGADRSYRRGFGKKRDCCSPGVWIGSVPSSL